MTAVNLKKTRIFLTIFEDSVWLPLRIRETQSSSVGSSYYGLVVSEKQTLRETIRYR